MTDAKMVRREKMLWNFLTTQAFLRFGKWKMTSTNDFYTARFKLPPRVRQNESVFRNTAASYGRGAAGKINLYPRGGRAPLTDSRIVRQSLSWAARIVKNDDGALWSWQFSLHYGEHQSCAAFARDECLAPQRVSFSWRLTSYDLAHRGHSSESKSSHDISNSSAFSFPISPWLFSLFNYWSFLLVSISLSKYVIDILFFKKKKKKNRISYFCRFSLSRYGCRNNMLTLSILSNFQSLESISVTSERLSHTTSNLRVT